MMSLHPLDALAADFARRVTEGGAEVEATRTDLAAAVGQRFGTKGERVADALRLFDAKTGRPAALRSVAGETAFHPLRPPVFNATLDGAALTGLAGDIVAALRPHTEAADVAMLVHLLDAFGCAVGTNAYVSVGMERHPPRLFALFVGPTGRGRKGTAWGAVRPILERAAPDLIPRITSTMQSGEALVEAVRDGTGDDDAGVEDKRLLWIEPEFANLLAVKGRQGSTMTGLVRAAWDWGDLHNRTKMRPVKATCPHVCLIGHITPD